MAENPTDEQSTDEEVLKHRFVAVHGTWTRDWEAVLRLDPTFFAAFLALSSVPHANDHLGGKVRELIYLATSAAVTHLFIPGIRLHIRRALALGATTAEVMEVLELTSAIGIHAAQVGVPLLLEVLREEGIRPDPVPLTEEQEQLKGRFVAGRGYWHSFWDGLLSLDADMFKAYTDFSTVPWQSNALDPKVKELVYCAIDASTTHLYTPGLKMHFTNAVRLGATQDEVMEVLEIVSLVGIDTVTVAAPILLEEWDLLKGPGSADERGRPLRAASTGGSSARCGPSGD